MGEIWTPGPVNRGLDKVEGGWQRRPELERHLPAGIEPGTRAYSRGECRVLLSRHPATRRWHLSISCADRDPTWTEIRDARYSLMPAGIVAAIILPPPREYINVHEHTFHVHEIERPEEGL